MFTGIVEELGSVAEMKDLGDAARIAVRGSTVTSDARHGDSISVNGVCLTVVEVLGDTFTADVMKETLDRSSLGALAVGDPVNLERAAMMTTRLGGHMVQGHVDARGQFVSVADHGESWTVRIAFPPEIARYLVFKGSVAVEGISLTIANLADDYFEIAIIPKTWEVTNLSRLEPGDSVNLEVDVIGKYVERLLAFG
jgi:riboflavin synthase